MSTTRPASSSPATGDAGAPAKILWNLPDSLQTIEVLRALICAEEAGYRRCKLEAEVDEVLARVNLSGSAPS